MPGELIPITLFLIVPIIVKIVSDNNIKKRVIDQGLVNADLRYLYIDRLEHHIPAAFKWGLVCIAVGLGILIGQIYKSDEITVAAMLMAGGAALIIYHFIAKKWAAEAKNDHP